MNEGHVFHAGEKAVQTRLGVRDKVQQIGARLIRDHLTAQHREFYAELPTLLIGSRDASGAIWASMLSGEPGFVQSPDPAILQVRALPIDGDPLAETLRLGAPLGVLGLQFETRRRNRASGLVSAVDEEGFSLAVKQCFGNCPKYIQTRSPQAIAGGPVQARSYPHLTGEDRALIRRADTFFIASGAPGAVQDPSAGNDVSHRGGRPGFVRADGNTLTWPDFVGNFLFNTLGNLAVDPRAGLLFLDFERGDMLQLSGRAEVLWDDSRTARFPGAERLVQFQTDAVVRIDGGLSLRWTFGEPSPFNQRTGVW